MSEIMTLTAEQGRRYEEDGQAIASYGRSIVFMPKECEPGKEYRVKLEEIREDSRGRMMYRGVPTEVEYTDRWKDNADGTASKVTIALSWTLEESEVGVVETKELETRENEPMAQTRVDRSVIWGSGLDDSYVEEIQTKVIPIVRQVVKNGELKWEKIDEREEQGEPSQVSLIEVSWKPVGVSEYALDSEALRFLVVFGDKRESLWITLKSQEVPAWLQPPVCSCGRQRYEAQGDGYEKCELCRQEESCVRCAKQAKVANLQGRLVCDDCRPYEKMEQLISECLDDTTLQAIAEEASQLLQGQVLDQEAGQMVLKAGLSHIESSWDKSRIFDKWNGYLHYYFTSQGVFGTKLAPAALEILRFLPQATGNSLVELVCWFAQGPKTFGNTPDFYVVTQVEGQEFAIKDFENRTGKNISSLLDDIEHGQSLAKWLRGSEAERQGALEALYQAKAEIPDGYQYLLDKAHQTFQDQEQNYTLVLEKISAAYAAAKGQRVLDQLLTEEYSSCPVCNESISQKEAHYCSGQEILLAKGYGQDFLVKVSRVGNAELVSLEAVYNNSYNDYEIRLVINYDALVDDLSAIETKSEFTDEVVEEEGEFSLDDLVSKYN